ncbi:seven-hairpin glycosidase [Schizopora paradoxa]|uniref:alpha-1,2-Mannosidase n=1 Tax=Schizopora paradoxa TaxID=27342 RepID=A0A0H2SB82_9AGAM|nr:seven-hairpin glycosidase [Schizopora paradoxa]
MSRNRRASAILAFIFLVAIGYYLLPASNQADGVPSPSTGYSRTRPDYSRWPAGRRAEAVKEAFGHAYASYERFALPADELKPLRNTSQQNFNGWGVTMYDALDTLWIMDMKPQFEVAIRWISLAEFHSKKDAPVMFFETVIRYLGGLLSAYALSGRSVLLEKANLLGQKLSPAFGTESGMPAFALDTDTGKVDLGPRYGNAVLAEIASCQMEYKYLAHLTGNRAFFRLANHTMDWMQSEQLSNGMWDTEWNITTGVQFDDHITIGALADSGYEYLLKQYIMSGRTEVALRDMYLRAAAGMVRNLLFLSPNRDILYVTDIYGVPSPTSSKPGGRDSDSDPTVVPSRKFEHLSCFLPGLLALGAHTLRSEADSTMKAELDLHMLAARGLARSCWLMYVDQPSGLAPEEVVFGRSWRDRSEDVRDMHMPWMAAVEKWRRDGGAGDAPGVGDGKGAAQPMPDASTEDKDYFVLTSKYLLRPETIESLYVLYRTTGENIWRERAWSIFLAIEDHCRQRSGYTSVIGVDRRRPDKPTPLDEMPSYALAETWKYLYLLFLEHDPFPMDKFVFNTEAHPFPIFHWNNEERVAFGLA